VVGDAFARDARILVEIADCTEPKDIPPPLPAMLGCIVDHVAALTERLEVRRRAIARIMIEVRAGEDDIGHPDRCQHEPGLHRNTPAPIRPPAADIGIPPASVAEMDDAAQMRPAAPLALGTGAIEPDRLRQLQPIDRVKPAVLGADRHDDSMSQSRPERKRIRSALFTVRCVTVPYRTRPRSSAKSPNDRHLPVDQQQLVTEHKGNE